LIEENFSLGHPNRSRVRCTLRLPRSQGSFRLVIVAHGFRGFKDWGFLPYLCESLCQSGFAALSFNHSLCGVRENPFQITDLEQFSRSSTTQELNDWDLIMDSLLLGNFPHSNRISLYSLGIVGHSRGGSYGILMANRYPQIRAIVAWGAIQTFQRFSPDVQRQWREKGYLEIAGNESENGVRLNVSALDALENNQERLDILKVMRGLSVPVLLLHGREDKVVPLKEGQKLWQTADHCLSRFHIIEDGGHTFRTQHPFAGPSPALSEAVRETIAWLEKKLR
jgi:pimeloyl-ACP methyl ester carboxylesterase